MANPNLREHAVNELLDLKQTHNLFNSRRIALLEWPPSFPTAGQP